MKSIQIEDEWDYGGSERSVKCRCGKYHGRDMVRIAHEYNDILGWTVNEIFGARCEACGINWQAYQNFGGCYGFDLKDFCESEAEVAFFREYLTSMEVFKPQVYLPFADNNAFFVDFVDASFHIGIEIDGNTHKGHEERDTSRDKLIYDIYGIKITRFRVRRGLMFEHYSGPHLDFVA